MKRTKPKKVLFKAYKLERKKNRKAKRLIRGC